VNLLNKVLGIVAGVLLIDHEVRKKDFQQVPYHRYRTFFSSLWKMPSRNSDNIATGVADPG
jgi:hypothetical protein